MPWLALPFSHRALKAKLNEAFGISGIPSLVIIGPDGVVITKDGRAAVNRDPEGAQFPWYPPPYELLEQNSFVNEEPTCLILADICDKDTAKTLEVALKEAATEMQAKCRKADIRVRFALALPNDQMVLRIRKLVDIEPSTCMILIDIPHGQKYYKPCSNVITKESIMEFVLSYKAKSIQPNKLNL